MKRWWARFAPSLPPTAPDATVLIGQRCRVARAWPPFPNQQLRHPLGMGHGFYDFDYFGSIQISSGKRASHGLKQGVHPPIGLDQWHLRIQVTIIEFSKTIEIINHKVSSIGVLTFTIAIK